MKLLILLSRFPYPLTKGDRLRAFNQIKYLSENNEIYLFCLNHSNVKQEYLTILSQYCQEISVAKLSKIGIVFNVLKAFFTGKPLQVGYFTQAKAKKQFNKFCIKIEPDKIYCQLIRTLEYVASGNKQTAQTPIILDFQDAFSKSMERQANISSFINKMVLNREAKLVERYELQALQLCSATTIISAADRNFIKSATKSQIAVIPNGVDLDLFQPQPNAQKLYDIVFVGRMSYPPNINAALYLVQQIMPLVWNKNPKITVLIAGADPTSSVKSLHSEQVRVVSYFADIREAYNSARIFVAPMQIGAGLQNKLLEAMAMKIPCITSVLANNSLQAIQQKEILIAENPDEYANLLIELLNEASLQKELSGNAFQFVNNNYSWQYHTKNLENIIINAK